MNTGVNTIPEALEALSKGKFVVVMDNEDRENEGDLIMPAEFATEESLAFMIRYCSGVICVAATASRLHTDLALPLMVPNNTEARKCKFTVSIDASTGTSTGISAADRALTIRAVANQDDDDGKLTRFNSPGHVFPLVAQDGGVLVRAGHTEAAVDLARLTPGCVSPCGYLCELNDDRGQMMRRPALEHFAQEHGLPIITISDLIRYRCATESLVVQVESPHQVVLDTPFGAFQHVQYQATFGLEDPAFLKSSRVYDLLSYMPPTEEHEVEEVTWVHFADTRTMQGQINMQWAQAQIVRARRRGLIICDGKDEALIAMSGVQMASESIFGLKVQMLLDLGISDIAILGEMMGDWTTSGFRREFHVAPQAIALATTSS